MKVPVEWLREHVDLRKSARELADRLTMTGTHIEEILPGKGTEILDIEVTTNRPDLLSVRGVAREVAAVTGSSLKKLSVEEPPLSKRSILPLRIQILDKKGSRRYIGRVFDAVKVGPSPPWLEKRVQWMDQKPINSVVDITNFCLYDIGQPLHAFDYGKIRGQSIVVRRARKGEKIVGINEVEYELDERILVIADAVRPIAIAGVMGGLDTEVTSGTRRIVLESAHFDPILVRRSSRLLKLSTESSYRFERSIPWGRIAEGSRRAAEMFVKHCQAKPASKVVDVNYLKIDRRSWLKVGFQEINDLLGTTVSPARVMGILKGLGFKVKRDARKGVRVRFSEERPDVEGKVDIIEEVARIYGYDKIPEVLPPTRHEASPGSVSQAYLKIRRLKEFLAHQCFDEVVTHSLLSLESIEKSRIPADQGLMKILNPLSQEQEFLRPSGLPSFLRTLAYNVNRKEKDLKFFEVGKRFSHGREEDILSLAIMGAYDSSWQGSRESTLYHLKGVVENIFRFFNKELPAWAEETYLPGVFEEHLAIFTNAQRVVSLGRLNHELAESWDLTSDVYYAELSLDLFMRLKETTRSFQEIPRHPPVRRDVSFIVPKAHTVHEITEAMRKEGEPFLWKADLFDQYLGKNIPSGKRSLAFSLEYQKPDGTFTDEEIQRLHERITAVLKRAFNAEIR